MCVISVLFVRTLMQREGSRPIWLRARTPLCDGGSASFAESEPLGKFLHCVGTAHAKAGVLTQVIQLVVTVLFPRNPFQKNEQSKNI